MHNIIIKEIYNYEAKAQVTDLILHSLPQWFGIEDAIKDYVNGVIDKPYFAVYDGERVIGFASLEVINDYTIELYVLGLISDYHRMGIGSLLVSRAVEYAKTNNFKLIMVKTLGESSNDVYYKRTRLFYKSIGFYPLEEFKQIWDENNPCLIMVMPI